MVAQYAHSNGEVESGKPLPTQMRQPNVFAGSKAHRCHGLNLEMQQPADLPLRPADARRSSRYHFIKYSTRYVPPVTPFGKAVCLTWQRTGPVYFQ